MISPQEIKEQALRWWKPYLQSLIAKEAFFPRQIDRIGKIKPAQITSDFGTLKNEVDALYESSKNEKGIGYWVRTTDKNFRRTGLQILPDCLIFECEEDYLHVIGKEMDSKVFLRNSSFLLEQLPQLKEWILTNPLELISPTRNWEGIVFVCHYFISNPRPDQYLRQLPISIHTKFIEENDSLLQSLLDYLIPDHIRDVKDKRFAFRYYLKHDEPSIRIRFLDPSLALLDQVMDISLTLPDFERNDWPVHAVYITENKMNFLTLPLSPNALTIWSGGGFKVSHLKNAKWLTNKNIFYWGDIDVHGFQILHQIRSYHPQTQSVMMDKRTFESFQEWVEDGEENRIETLHLLTNDEAELYTLLKTRTSRNRLEQEKIPQWYVDNVFQKI
ncbi:Wadjet anti-phage system protein JetD domain-containing protein [Flaviaesturariibacter amylovorans]|uniref:DUF3322 and DUF2220 domain-containing protein n=1 Tax=Flaviaesturariibacter amylovorans TaxID=1084520 RepID=A0ABP8H608_9BACT